MVVTGLLNEETVLFSVTRSPSFVYIPGACALQGGSASHSDVHLRLWCPGPSAERLPTTAAASQHIPPLDAQQRFSLLLVFPHHGRQLLVEQLDHCR